MIELFSRYRSELMGLATVMVLLGHTVFYSNGAVSYGFLTDIVTLGYSSVEIFLFLSGFGLYFSMEKDDNKKAFYKRRLSRILPSVLLIVAFHISVNFCNLGLHLINPLYWFASYWYLGFILCAYIVYPYIYRLIKIGYVDQLVILTIVVTSILCTLIYVCFGGLYNSSPYTCFVTRIPIFILGSLIASGKLHFLDSQACTFFTLILGILGLLPFFYFHDLEGEKYFTLYLSLFLFIPPFMVCVTKMLNVLTYKMGILRWLGKYSLEIYLVQVTVMYRLMARSMTMFDNYFIILVCSIPPVIIVSYIMHIIAKQMGKIFA